MIKDIQRHLGQSALYAFAASCTIVALLFTAYFLTEPVIGHGATAQDTFTIKQTITSENSITVTDVTMAGDINGVTGGNATGSTQFLVISNNASGYTVTINFFDNGSEEAMEGETTGTNEIRDYASSTIGVPTYGFTASTAAQFGYTLYSSSSADTYQMFKDNGSVCNQSGGGQNAACWMAPSTTAYTIVDANDAATTGATSTLIFKVHVPSGADPTPQAQVYTATATLTMTTK